MWWVWVLLGRRLTWPYEDSIDLHITYLSVSVPRRRTDTSRTAHAHTLTLTQKHVFNQSGLLSCLCLGLGHSLSLSPSLLSSDFSFSIFLPTPPEEQGRLPIIHKVKHQVIFVLEARRKDALLSAEWVSLHNMKKTSGLSFFCCIYWNASLHYICMATTGRVKCVSNVSR